ncbi:MAG: flavodoxin-dependent (E)-4-hydroxy-3-methylbut-2-enyl-diphosphate synthase [Coriobacteriales bacterium]|jgi:(E)-4-hydroxy-3-methylbut-2-enyl-diphosphate synthase|nr:flavodoxin-dependent (E)-4-hydroxy-3-methylbut-2-enyl-diphosphate synthase [Coriobacteriales bacterium]
MPQPRDRSNQVLVGSVPIGGGAPVAVQSMLCVPTTNTVACLEQIEALAALGCEIIRVAVPSTEALPSFGQICKGSALPVVADIHFDHQLALGAVAQGAAKLRINPGNIGSWDKVDAVIDAAGAAGIPIRIGVNAGSLAPEYAERADMSITDKLVASATAFVRHFEQRGFAQLVLSAKAHDVATTLATYRRLAQELPQIPLHLGVTEAGTLTQGTVKSSVALGVLLLEGIGDTLRVSLTAGVQHEVQVAWELLAATGLRRRGPELVSCPTCGRCQVDLIALANEVQARLQQVSKPLSVAVMGCVVNGPGEAASADVGVACGAQKGAIFSQGKVLYTVPEAQIVDALFAEIEQL